MAASVNIVALVRPATLLPVVRFIVLWTVSLCHRLSYSCVVRQYLRPIA